MAHFRFPLGRSLKPLSRRLPSCAGVLVGLALLAAVQALAQEVAIFGSGSKSCGKWLSLRQDKVNHAVLKHWVLGFVSGSNWNASGPQARPPDADSVVAFVDQYCRNNPLHMISLAAAAVVQE